MVRHSVDMESVPMSFAPTQFRGQRLLPGMLGPLMFVFFVVFGVIFASRGQVGESVIFLALAALLGSAVVFTWSNHLRVVQRAARGFNGVTYLMFGGCNWTAGQEPYDGGKFGQGFVRIGPGELEIRTGGEAKLVARYEAGQLERAVALRVMWGLLEPPVRLTFTDGMSYDVMLDHAGPRGLLPIRRRELEKFIADTRAALGPSDAAH